ncbi:MAG: pyrroline-5-carboxylate reductase [Pseudomonadota bacterium]|nr:pyrroline-5-carboxylate reductase [Desulfobacterales bacterium]MBL6967975.1 pyrroline-5-carboxylate reductase [Desulfobacteraceae bacterium]MBL7101850.1 pyrroline-5-carboxylate reductase [Desulfobacteraceae bacterium]MBL7173951.1 pyrroline-5-carboxylate reductase [Desulfobacteraceae bacterium]
MSGNQNLGFIGAGNMATALVKGLIESGVYDRQHLLAADKDKEALKRVSGNFGIKCHESNLQVTSESAIVVLSVKPQNMREVLEEIKGEIRDDHLIISIAAGIPLRMIHEIVRRDIPLIRVMPNTPALVQKGVSALAGGALATGEHMAMAGKIFGAVGDTVEVEERMMDAVTALSGSGPGYVFRIMECMVEAGIAVGLEKETALSLVIGTFLGAAHLAKASDDSLSELRQKVTSPGGTTAAGLAVFDEKGLKKMTIDAIDAACKRSLELGKNY